MPLYLVVHTPEKTDENEVRPPTRLAEFAAEHGREDSRPRWIKTWSPDLHEDRVFSLWESGNAEDIMSTIQKFGFLDEMSAHAVAVKEWGPESVFAETDA